MPKIGSLDKGSGSSRRTDIEKSVDEMQSELDKLLASTNFLDLGIDLNDPSFLNVRVLLLANIALIGVVKLKDMFL